MKTIPKELEGILVQTSDTLHGAARFNGTRVFAYRLFDYVLTGRSLQEFLEDYEGVQLAQAQAVLNWELKRIRDDLQAAS